MFEAEIKSHTGLEWFQLQQTFTGIPVNPGPRYEPRHEGCGSEHTHRCSVTFIMFVGK